MALVYAQDVLEIAINCTYGGRPHVNVLHVKNDEAGGSDVDKVRDVLNNWQDHMMLMSVAGLTLQGASWRSLDPSEGDLGTMAPAAGKPVAGISTALGSPPNLAYHVRKQTAGRQRGQRDGRLFIGGVPETVVDEFGNVSSAQVTNVQGALNSFLSGINDTNFAGTVGSGLVVLNTTPLSRAPGTQPVTVTYRAVTALTLDTKISTQRDRLR